MTKHLFYILIFFIASCGLLNNEKEPVAKGINYGYIIKDYQLAIETNDISPLNDNLDEIVMVVHQPSSQISDSACIIFPSVLMWAHLYNDCLTFLNKKSCGSDDILQKNICKHILAESNGDFSNKYIKRNLRIFESRMSQAPMDSLLLYDYYTLHVYLNGVDSTKKELANIIQNKTGYTKGFYESYLSEALNFYSRCPDSTY